jgi:hypothetical protein
MKTATRSRPARSHSAVPQSPRPAPARKPARPALRTTAIPAYRNGFLTGMGVGMTVALVLIAVALFTGIGARTSPGQVASALAHQRHDDAAAAADQGSKQDTAVEAATAADLKVSARHLGGLQLLVEADVASKQSHSALIKADVEAILDMTEMPGSHKKQVVLKDVEGRPGHYAGIVSVPMVGQWDVLVRSRSPLKGETHQFIQVGTVLPGQSGVPQAPPGP